MKTRKWMTLVGLGMAVALMAAPAVAQTMNLSADVPVNFIVGTTEMSAGRCTVHTLIGRTVQLYDSERHSAMAILSEDDVRDANDAKMIFHRYGDQFFLVRIETPDASYKLPISKAEKRLAQQSAPQVVAFAASGSGAGF